MSDGTIINAIWNIFRRLSDLSKDDVWRCVQIHDAADNLIRAVPRGSNIRPGFVEFFATDFHNYEKQLERVKYMSFLVRQRFVNIQCIG